MYRKAERSSAKEYSTGQGRSNSAGVSSKLDGVDSWFKWNWKPDLHIQRRGIKTTEDAIDSERYKRKISAGRTRSYEKNTRMNIKDYGNDFHTSDFTDSGFNRTTETDASNFRSYNNYTESKNIEDNANNLHKLHLRNANESMDNETAQNDADKLRSYEKNWEINTIEENGNTLHMLEMDNVNESVVNGTIEHQENGKNFMEEADRLIKEYKKKCGSRDNLNEIEKDVDYERKLNDTRIKEMLRDKVLMRNTGKTEVDIDKRNSGIVAKINRKNACFHCGDSVYQKEKLGPIRDVLFHAYCFRCSTCGTTLNLYNYYQNHKDMHDRAVYCKSHQPSPESSKVDISDKSIQALINKPKLERVSSNVRAGPDSKSAFGRDAVIIKNALNAPKLGTYNPTVRVTVDTGSMDRIDTKSVVVQTAMKAPKLDVYNTTVRPVPTIAQNGRTSSQQRNSGVIKHAAQSADVHYGSKPLHSLYLHQP